MRIVSGLLGGRKIDVPPNIRPTLEKVREAIFSMIDVKNKTFLDLFAGSGSIGIEAYSRGAKEVWFIEKNEKIFSVLKKNVSNLMVQGKAVKGNVFSVLKNIDKRFDIIFLDPPYDEGYIKRTIQVIPKVLSDEGMVIIESSKREKFELNGFKVLKEKKYGDTIITILKGIKYEDSSISGNI